MPRAASVILASIALLAIGPALWLAWKEVRGTSLRHTLIWLAIAWLAWLVSTTSSLWAPTNLPYRYLAVSLSVCGAVAVLGARQPGMAAWNFVVAALLAILLLPLLQQAWGAPAWRLDGPRAALMFGLLFIVVVNHLPTRMGLLGFLAGLLLAGEVVQLTWPEVVKEENTIGPVAHVAFALAFVVWGVRWLLNRPVRPPAVNRLWVTFRDRYGLLWGRRVLEQFNAAAANAGWEQRLTWFHGLTMQTMPDELREQDLLKLLQATLKRFGLGEERAAV
jgi:hypothetical protein